MKKTYQRKLKKVEELQEIMRSDNLPGYSPSLVRKISLDECLDTEAIEAKKVKSKRTLFRLI